MNIDNDPNNLVDILHDWHDSSHPEAYHQWVYDHLVQAKSTNQFIAQLRKLGDYIRANPRCLKKDFGPYPNL